MDSINIHRPSKSPEIDPSTFSNYYEFKVNETVLNFDIDFSKKKVSGDVTFDLISKNSDLKEIWLDTSYLIIHSITINDQPTKSTLNERTEPLGSRLNITLPSSTSNITLRILFETTSKCTALQFLEKEATDGKSAPYLFSQCQAIHARSLFPCFDTPSIKSPYKMSVKSPYPSLMSGREVSSETTDIYKFNQPIPIPSYLISLASGDITLKPIGPRSSVFCESINVDKCKYEFENDMENFIVTAESLVFSYEWDKYNALVLPLSFPYGGMENPNITFVTPTLISGDRENVDVLAHELSHSWSGNLVTNCSWEHFWINEGWTVYLERRIQGQLHGQKVRDFSGIIGWIDLENSITSMGKSADKFSTLVQNLANGVDPDDSFSSVPYEKGYNLLYHIENTVGIEQFNKFIPYYFNNFKYKSLDTYQFLDCLYDFFKSQKHQLDTIDWETWLFKPGMPPQKPNFDTSLVNECYNLADKWFNAIINNESLDQFEANDISNFSANQSVVFLDTLSSFNKADDFHWSNHKNALKELSDKYSTYSNSKNCEVIFRWFILQVGGHNPNFYDQLGDWLGTVGRMKFVRPGYLILNDVDHDKAVSYFEKFELSYHPICKSLVKKDLGL